jgi:hypothetical protein
MTLFGNSLTVKGMKVILAALFLNLAIFQASCGVKGKPQAPLKKTEQKNEISQKLQN